MDSEGIRNVWCLHSEIIFSHLYVLCKSPLLCIGYFLGIICLVSPDLCGTSCIMSSWQLSRIFRWGTSLSAILLQFSSCKQAGMGIPSARNTFPKDSSFLLLCYQPLILTTQGSTTWATFHRTMMKTWHNQLKRARGSLGA